MRTASRTLVVAWIAVLSFEFAVLPIAAHADGNKPRRRDRVYSRDDIRAGLEEFYAIYRDPRSCSDLSPDDCRTGLEEFANAIVRMPETDYNKMVLYLTGEELQNRPQDREAIVYLLQQIQQNPVIVENLRRVREAADGWGYVRELFMVWFGAYVVANIVGLYRSGAWRTPIQNMRGPWTWRRLVNTVSQEAFDHHRRMFLIAGGIGTGLVGLEFVLNWLDEKRLDPELALRNGQLAMIKDPRSGLEVSFRRLKADLESVTEVQIKADPEGMRAQAALWETRLQRLNTDVEYLKEKAPYCRPDLVPMEGNRRDANMHLARIKFILDTIDLRDDSWLDEEDFELPGEGLPPQENSGDKSGNPEKKKVRKSDGSKQGKPPGSPKPIPPGPQPENRPN